MILSWIGFWDFASNVLFYFGTLLIAVLFIGTICIWGVPTLGNFEEWLFYEKLVAGNNAMGTPILFSFEEAQNCDLLVKDVAIFNEGYFGYQTGGILSGFHLIKTKDWRIAETRGEWNCLKKVKA